MGEVGEASDTEEHSALRKALHDLDTQLSVDTFRGHGAHRRFAPLVEKLRTPQASFLRTELEQRLARCVEADDSVARDQWARILADACGEEALPALLRAMATDRNDDGDTLQLNVLRLLDAWPDTSLRQALDLVASDAPGIRRVGLWCLSVLDFGGTRHFGRVAAAASDPEPEVRADVMDTLGSIFGTGDPSRARVLLMAGADDPAPEVRRSAVSALQAWHDVTVTGVLVTRSGDTDPWVRFAAAWSLARRPAPEARAALVRLTTDRHTDVREAAGTVLALGTEAASG